MPTYVFKNGSFFGYTFLRGDENKRNALGSHRGWQGDHNLPHAQGRDSGGAERAGRHRRTHLSAIERGERKPTLETLYRISLALEVKMSDIIVDIEDILGTNS